jgi:predicted TIM-barrel fold metal-dependent hydrolase
LTTRRGFLKSTVSSGIMFCTCGLLDAAHAQQAVAGRHSPVRVGGKRVRTIDTHAHCYFHESLALMGAEAQDVVPQTKGVPEMFIPADDHAAVTARLAAMDAMGIDMEVLSINPFWYKKDRNTASAIVKLHNQKFADLLAAYPRRFAAFASLSLQYPDLAVQELQTAVQKQGLRGAAIGSSVNGEDFSNPKFYPVWAKAEELGAVLFIHPQSQPELKTRYQGNGWLSNTIGNPLDTTIALEHMIFEGTLDKFPGLKILAAHGGGYLGSYAARSDHSCFVSPQNCDAQILLKKKPSEYLRDIYVDALVFTPAALKFLISQVGIDRVVLGTDYPIPWERHPVDQIFATSLTDAERRAILGGNATALLNLTA